MANKPNTAKEIENETRIVCDIEGRDILPRLPLIKVEEIKQQPKKIPFDL